MANADEVHAVDPAKDVGHRTSAVVVGGEAFDDAIDGTRPSAGVDDCEAQRGAAGVEHEDQAITVRSRHGRTLQRGIRGLVADPDAEPREEPTDESVEEVAERIAEHNEDEVTRREAFEQELQAQGRTEEGGEIGDAMP
jgi:hypothetical protein